MKRISFILGTRPEAIKLCPLILAMQENSDLEPHVCITGQHREMLDQVFEVFAVKPDIDLALMQPNQTLASLTSRAVAAIDGYLEEYKPDMVIVQGDTTTVFTAALCAFYHHIPIGHLEAGLRTWNRYSPFPEEINRVLTSRLADMHFAPTELSRQNLLREEVPDESIIVTGNTVIDALMMAITKIETEPQHISGLAGDLQPSVTDGPRIVLITGHRRENFGDGFENICHAIAELAIRFPDVHFVYPVHLNPNVREPVNRLLAQPASDEAESTTGNIHLIEPLSYLPFVAMMNRATLILTDSGGVQEEAPSLGKPVLVMRNTTERPEAVNAGTVKIVGTDRFKIVNAVSALLTDNKLYSVMAMAHNPYGDGKASAKIIEALLAV